MSVGATSDLGGLAKSGQIVTPGRDPFSDGDLNLNQAEQRVLKITGSAFSSAAALPDADGNGKIDVLEGKFYLPYMGYYMDGSFAGGSLVGQVPTPTVFDHFDFCFQDQSTNTTKPPTTSVSFTGPSGSGLSNTPAIDTTSAGKYCTPDITGVAVLPAGLYTATYDGGTLSFLTPDQSTAPQDMLVIVPTIVLNSDNTINSLNWTYRLGDGSNEGAINPVNVITGLHIYMTDTAGSDRAYDSGTELPPATTTHVLTNQTLKWSDITVVEIDLYTWYHGCIIFYFSKT